MTARAEKKTRSRLARSLMRNCTVLDSSWLRRRKRERSATIAMITLLALTSIKSNTQWSKKTSKERRAAKYWSTCYPRRSKSSTNSLTRSAPSETRPRKRSQEWSMKSMTESMKCCKTKLSSVRRPKRSWSCSWRILVRAWRKVFATSSDLNHLNLRWSIH